MSIGLYMDQHVPKAITDGLRLRGVDCITALEDYAATMDDPDLLNRASALGRALVTSDKDFLVEADKRQTVGTRLRGLFTRIRCAYQSVVALTTSRSSQKPENPRSWPIECSSCRCDRFLDGHQS